MKMSVLIFNIIFIIIAALFIFPSLKRVIKYKSSSISDYVILLIAIFNVVPVLCDVIIGVPTYVYWYRSFDPVMTDFDTCLIYNTYIIITIMILQYYAYKRTKKNKKSNVVDTVRLSVFRHPAFDVALILLPLIFVVAKYGIRVFYGYSMLGTRNIQSGDSQLINQMITLSVYIYSTRYFSRLRKTREFILMLVFFFALIWLNGKRYMIVSIGEVIFYLYQMTNRKTTRRVKLGLILTGAVLFIIAFSVYYLTNVKVNTASEYLYGTLRVDFGRDDVTKYVIKQVLLDGNKILDYPGQTVIADLLMFVPRSIWPGKPYPHYRYLTAAILGVGLQKIPAGTTPSLFEMNLCNFSWFGIPVTIIFLLALCRYTDRRNNLSIKVVMLLILTNLLSQALDAVMILIPVIILYILSYRIKFPEAMRRFEIKQNSI